MMTHFRFILAAIAALCSCQIMAQDFEVQAAAYADSMQRASFEDQGIHGVIIKKGENGIYRYIVGVYQTREIAESIQAQLVQKGYRYASISDLKVQQVLSSRTCGYNDGRSEPTLPDGVKLILFEPDKSAIDAAARTVLDEFAEKMKKDPALTLRVMGFNDNTGTAESSEKIAGDRARAARNYLIGKGIRPDRMDLEIYGESYPIYPNKDMEGKTLPENQRWNRRVMLKFK